MIHALYVDDEPALLDLGKTFLEQSRDISIDTDLSPKDALARATTGRYDAIISDYQMPEMDGISLLKQIRKSGQRIPFILFTGRGREEVVIDALNNGADYYLQKGGNPRAQFAELRNMIVQAAGRRRIEAELKQSEERYRNVVEDQTEATLPVQARPDARLCQRGLLRPCREDKRGADRQEVYPGQPPGGSRSDKKTPAQPYTREPPGEYDPAPDYAGRVGALGDVQRPGDLR